MHRWHRSVVMVASLGLLLGTLALSPSPAFASSFTYPCHARSGIFDYQEAVERGAGLGGTGSDYHAIIGDANLRTIATCSSPPTGGVITAVLAANLQSSNSSFDIVQLGYAQCTMPAGATCGDSTFPIPNDGKPHFVYICNDVSGGNPCSADHWAGAPIVGHRYRFRIEISGGTWKYTITDKGTGIAKTASIPADWNLADGAWWGGEATDSYSMLGPKNTDSPQVDMYWMQYLRNATGGNWQVAHPDTRKCQVGLSPGCSGGSWPSWFGGSTTRTTQMATRCASGQRRIDA